MFQVLYGSPDPTGTFRILSACTMMAFVLSMTFALFSSSLAFSLSCIMQYCMHAMLVVKYKGLIAADCRRMIRCACHQDCLDHRSKQSALIVLRHTPRLHSSESHKKEIPYHPDGQLQLALLLKEDGVRAVLGGRPQQRRLGRGPQEAGQRGLVRVAPRQDDLGPLQLRRGIQLPLSVQLGHPAHVPIFIFRQPDGLLNNPKAPDSRKRLSSRKCWRNLQPSGAFKALSA